MIKTKVIRSLFRNGLALTTGIALTFTSYSFAKNLTMDALIFYSLFLIVVTLTGLAISYFAYLRLRDALSLPMGFIIVPYSIITIEISILLLRSFIHFHVPYGYLLLPMAIEIAGAVIFMILVHILWSGLKIKMKLSLMSSLVLVASVGILLT